MKNIHQRIKDKLAKGETIYSKAAGRWGEIIGVDDPPYSLVRFKLHRTPKRIAVTSFLGGDPVRLIRGWRLREWLLVNVWNKSTSNRQQGKRAQRTQ